jgi:hypothetical protein
MRLKKLKAKFSRFSPFESTLFYSIQSTSYVRLTSSELGLAFKDCSAVIFDNFSKGEKAVINVFDVFVKIAIVSQLLGEAALHTAAFFLGGGGGGHARQREERLERCPR